MDKPRTFEEALHSTDSTDCIGNKQATDGMFDAPSRYTAWPKGLHKTDMGLLTRSAPVNKDP